jgi:hypothetical protein
MKRISAKFSFFYNLDILYGGLGIGKLQFLIKKEKKMDPDPYWSPTSNSGSGSGSVKNEYGSTTLVLISVVDPDPTFFHPQFRIQTVSIPDRHQRI